MLLLSGSCENLPAAGGPTQRGVHVGPATLYILASLLLCLHHQQSTFYKHNLTCLVELKSVIMATASLYMLTQTQEPDAQHTAPAPQVPRKPLCLHMYRSLCSVPQQLQDWPLTRFQSRPAAITGATSASVPAEQLLPAQHQPLLIHHMLKTFPKPPPNLRKHSLRRSRHTSKHTRSLHNCSQEAVAALHSIYSHCKPAAPQTANSLSTDCTGQTSCAAENTAGQLHSLSAASLSFFFFFFFFSVLFSPSAAAGDRSRFDFFSLFSPSCKQTRATAGHAEAADCQCWPTAETARQA